MASIDEASRFLQQRGTSLERVAAAVEAVPPAEAVLLVGSVAEGLANGRSDIDLLHLGDSDIPADADYLRFDAGGAGLAFKSTLNGLRVQVESLSVGWLADLAARMGRTVADLHGTDPIERRLYMFSDQELRNLHSIRTGIPLRHGDAADAWRERLHTEFLATLLLLTMVGRHFMFRDDAMGEASESRPESAAWAVREAIGYAAAAALASVGETHPYAKWRIRLLQRHRAAIGGDRADALIRCLSRQEYRSIEQYLEEAWTLCDDTLAEVFRRRPDALEMRSRISRQLPSASEAQP